jgi:hypothetical protein
MKLLLTAAALLVSAATLQADITINLAGGNLYRSDGITLQPEGTIVQLIVSRGDNIFTAPTPDSFTGNSPDDLILETFTVNSGPGFFAEPVNFTLSGTLGPNDRLLLRWFPTLLAGTSAPGGGAEYGEFRTDTVQSDPDGSDIAWFVPSDGSIVGLNFLTENQGGSNPEVAGIANFTVIPEPSTYALLAVGIAAIGIVRRRRKSLAV